MRVRNTSTSTTSTSTGVRRSGRGGGGGFRPAERADAAVAAPTGAVGMLASVDALAALQSVDEVGDAAAAAAGLVARGDALLDDLDRLRHGLLEGEVDGAALDDLRRRLGARRAAADDAELTDILDAIEQRCAVELAKHERDAPAPAPAAEPHPAPSELAVLARAAYGRAGR